MNNVDPLYSLSEAARVLGTDRKTIAGLVRAHGLPTRPLPSNVRAKAIDEAAMRVIGKALGRPYRRPVMSA